MGKCTSRHLFRYGGFHDLLNHGIHRTEKVSCGTLKQLQQIELEKTPYSCTLLPKAHAPLSAHLLHTVRQMEDTAQCPWRVGYGKERHTLSHTTPPTSLTYNLQVSHTSDDLIQCMHMFMRAFNQDQFIPVLVIDADTWAGNCLTASFC